MKKTFSLLLSLLLLLLCCTACSPKPLPEERTAVRIAGMKGPTSMGMVGLMDESEKGQTENTYEFSVVAGADEITPKLIRGELDIAALPANVASVLYNNTEGRISVLAVNTLGVLYIVQKGETLSSLSDLKGKTVYATGKGTVPEYNLRYLLSQNGLDPEKDVTIEWKSEPTEVVAALKSAESGIAMLPQPFVTVALGSVEGLAIAFDLTAEWEKSSSGSSLVTGVLAIRTDFAKEHPEEVKTFLEEYRRSLELTRSDPDGASALIEKYGIVNAAVAKKALPYCNLTLLTGSEMKQALSGYLAVLFDGNAAAVGGALPKDDFYCAADNQ